MTRKLTTQPTGEQQDGVNFIFLVPFFSDFSRCVELVPTHGVQLGLFDFILFLLKFYDSFLFCRLVLFQIYSLIFCIFEEKHKQVKLVYTWGYFGLVLLPLRELRTYDSYSRLRLQVQHHPRDFKLYFEK